MTFVMVNELLEEFVKLMDSGVLIWAAPLACAGLWFVYWPLMTVHELGHAVVGLTCTTGRVLVRVGRAPGLIRGRLGRLEISWNIRSRHREDDGQVVLETPISDPRAGLVFALAGPFANVFFALLLIPTCAALSGIPQVCLAAIIAFSLFVAAWNLAPRPGSDGRAALYALRTLIAQRRVRSVEEIASGDDRSEEARKVRQLDERRA